VTQTITRIRDGWDSVDESLDAAADRLINSAVGMGVAGVNLGFGAYFVLTIATEWQSISSTTSVAMTALAAVISLSIVLSGFMLAWRDDV
jgi:hypothetical protein